MFDSKEMEKENIVDIVDTHMHTNCVDGKK